MSYARKCDMCGKCFDPYEEKGRMARFPKNPYFQTANEISEGVRGILLIDDEGPDSTIDLCPACSDKFYSLFHPETPLNASPDKVNECLDRFSDLLQLNNGIDHFKTDLSNCSFGRIFFKDISKFKDGDTDGDDING